MGRAAGVVRGGPGHIQTGVGVLYRGLPWARTGPAGVSPVLSVILIVTFAVTSTVPSLTVNGDGIALLLFEVVGLTGFLSAVGRSFVFMAKLAEVGAAEAENSGNRCPRRWADTAAPMLRTADSVASADSFGQVPRLVQTVYRTPGALFTPWAAIRPVAVAGQGTFVVVPHRR